MKRRGTGVGCMFYGVGNTGLPNPAAAFVEVLPDSSVNVIVGAADIGQGSSTMAATVAAALRPRALRRADKVSGKFRSMLISSILDNRAYYNGRTTLCKQKIV